MCWGVCDKKADLVLLNWVFKYFMNKTQQAGINWIQSGNFIFYKGLPSSLRITESHTVQYKELWSNETWELWIAFIMHRN